MGLELLKQRISVRKYTLQPVEREKIEEIVDVARFAPTARNEQPWEYVVVTEQAVREEIANLTDYGKFIAEAPVCIAVFTKETKYYLEDGSAATTYILLAATSLGLGSCWVAGDKKEYGHAVGKLLGVPTGYQLVSLVSLGYSAEEHLKPKRQLEDLCHWERF